MSQLPISDLPDTHDAASIDVRLPDGGAVTLRPLGHGERGPLLSVLDGMSADSRALRYLTPVSRMTESMISALTDVDGDRHSAWLACVDGEPVGIARYVRLPGCATTADIAFEVVDRQHGRGIGTVLLDAIATVAACRGVREVQATMAPSNTASRLLLAKLGARTRFVDGLLEASGPLRLLEPPLVDRSAVLRLSCDGADEAASGIA